MMLNFNQLQMSQMVTCQLIAQVNLNITFQKRFLKRKIYCDELRLRAAEIYIKTGHENGTKKTNY